MSISDRSLIPLAATPARVANPRRGLSSERHPVARRPWPFWRRLLAHACLELVSQRADDALMLARHLRVGQSVVR